MGVPGGLGSQFGLAKETTYGTPVTVDHFLEYGPTESMALSRAFLMSAQYRAGRLFQSSTRRSATTKSGAGAIPLEVPNKGFGIVLDCLHGNTVTPAQIEAGAAYKQVHEVGTTDNFAKSRTIQIGKPKTDGTVQPFTYPGSILTSLDLALQTGGFLTATTAWDAQDEKTATALASASYPTGLESFNFTDAEIKVNGSVFTQARGFTLKIDTPKDVGRYYLGAELKAQPLVNQYYAGALTFTTDFKDMTVYEIFAKGELCKVEINITGATIAGPNKYELKILCESVGLDGSTPVVPGPGPLTVAFPFVVLDDGTHAPFKITYVSTDITL